MHLNDEDLAERGYAAYAESTGGKAFDGRDMPKWGDLPENIKRAWTAAATRIRIAAAPEPWGG